MELADLLALADAALDPGGGPDQQISRIMNYSESFELWYGQNRAALEQQSAGNMDPPLEELGRRHRLVVDTAAGLMKSASSDLKALRQKAKGLMAYADLFPQRHGKEPGRGKKL